MLTVAEVAERWRVSERAIRGLVARGGLRHTKFGKLVRIPEAAVVELEASGIPRFVDPSGVR